MYRKCKNSQAIQRQTHIVDSLLTLMKRKSFNEISITQLCEKAGVPRRAFYRYFDSITDVLDALLDFAAEEFNKWMARRDREEFTAVDELEQMFCFWYESRKMLDAIINAKMSGWFIDDFSERLIESRILLDYFSVVNRTDSIADTDWVYFVANGLFALILRWTRTRDPRTPRQMAELVIRLLTEAPYDLNKSMMPSDKTVS